MDLSYLRFKFQLNVKRHCKFRTTGPRSSLSFSVQEDTHVLSLFEEIITFYSFEWVGDYGISSYLISSLPVNSNVSLKNSTTDLVILKPTLDI